MKINLKLLSTILGVSLFLAFASCSKEEPMPDPPAEANMTEEDAADIIEGALGRKTGGLSKEVEQTAAIADQYTTKALLSPCGETRDTTISYEHNGLLITANYSTSTSYTVNCNNLDVPVSIDFSSQTNGSYASQRMTSTNSGTSSWNLDNLAVGTNFILNGTYSRTGTQSSLVREQNTFNSDFDLTLENIKIDKTTYEIESGTATYSLNAEVEGGNAYSYEGSITFLGDQTAEVVINGIPFTIHW